MIACITLLLGLITPALTGRIPSMSELERRDTGPCQTRCFLTLAEQVSAIGSQVIGLQNTTSVPIGPFEVRTFENERLTLEIGLTYLKLDHKVMKDSLV